MIDPRLSPDGSQVSLTRLHPDLIEIRIHDQLRADTGQEPLEAHDEEHGFVRGLLLVAEGENALRDLIRRQEQLSGACSMPELRAIAVVVPCEEDEPRGDRFLSGLPCGALGEVFHDEVLALRWLRRMLMPQ